MIKEKEKLVNIEKKNPVPKTMRIKNSNTLIKDIEKESTDKKVKYKVTPISEMTSKVNGTLQRNIEINSGQFINYYKHQVDNRNNVYYTLQTTKSLYSIADIAIILTGLFERINLTVFTVKHIEEYLPGINNLFLRNELVRYIHKDINISLDTYYNHLFRKNININAILLWDKETEATPMLFNTEITLKKIKNALGMHTKMVSDSLYKLVVAMAKRNKVKNKSAVLSDKLNTYFPLPTLPFISEKEPSKNILWSDKEFFLYLANIFFTGKESTLTQFDSSQIKQLSGYFMDIQLIFLLLIEKLEIQGKLTTFIYRVDVTHYISIRYMEFFTPKYKVSANGFSTLVHTLNLNINAILQRSVEIFRLLEQESSNSFIASNTTDDKK